jgi:hypothetical protein
MLLASQAFAAGADAEIRRTFIQPWMNAMRSPDSASVRRFLHPQVLACLNDQTREYFDYVAAQEISRKVSGAYQVLKVAPMQGPPPAFLPADSFTYPVQPTYEVQVDSGDTTFVRYLAPAGGSWYEVYPCPNQKGMAFMHQQIVLGTEQRKQAAQLAAELKDPVLGEVQALLKQKRTIEAIKRYREATGADLTTAKMVVELIPAGQ